MAAHLLTEPEKRAIAGAIQKAEATTSGEIVFAIQDASAHYYHATLQAALAGMFLAVVVYLSIPIEHRIDIVLWIELVALALSYALFARTPWRRWFISFHEMDARVHEAALMEFYRSGLYKTKESNGVLIYLSCLERRVVVLGDRGIHEKMGDEHWVDVRDKIICGIRQKRACDGICDAVAACGRALGEHFPHRADDINELPDQVIERKLHSDNP